MIKVINPTDYSEVGQYHPIDTLDQQYLLAQERQKEWNALPLQERIHVIEKFQHLLSGQLEELASLLTQEMGKPLTQARNEIKGAQERISFFIENSATYLQEEIVYDTPELVEKITYEPLGVIGNISAWNYPYLVGVNVFIPALIGGNAVFYKPSEYTPLTGLKIEALWKEAGLPDGLFQCIPGGRESGEALLDLALDGYFFTGSYPTGKYIYEQVAQRMVPCQMELGGKDPLYVSQHNQDLSSVIAAVADGAFYNNGQSCCAVERIYVHQAIYDQFVEGFTDFVKKMKVGKPTDPDTYIGPLARKEQIQVLENQVSDAIVKGGILQCGGQALEGNFFAPTVISEAHQEMLLMQEESFGPIIGIQCVDHLEEAITLMNDSAFGLTASIYTDHAEEAQKAMQAFDSGSVYWNCCDRVSARLPWTGRKHSGIGSTLSHIGIRAFVQPKAWHFRGKK
ncbi:aldehyde dehydrogenase family protein [Algivirga pacifica]|uniref:Aldehyde dehydrogenase family protein n=1 Tax=Algivirga pacifica TaxID=1162670 RepID=A0ABP9D8Q8_9BACT